MGLSLSITLCKHRILKFTSKLAKCQIIFELERTGEIIEAQRRELNVQGPVPSYPYDMPGPRIWTSSGIAVPQATLFPVYYEIILNCFGIIFMS